MGSDNLEWISKATNWNKFNAVASLGLIHKGHEANALKLLDPYLPKGEADQFGFKEGGSLYAYVISYLRDQLLKATTSAARHGACLGLGLAAMGTHDEQASLLNYHLRVFVQLRDCLYQDDAVTGEAAGLAMGLVMVGGMQTEAYQEMVQYVCDTQHDKIQRGLRTGIALLAYGQQEEAEKLIAPLLEHKSNAVLRSTAVCMLAMAYAGSAKVAADPNQDVKRFAVIAIGFVLSKNDAIIGDTAHRSPQKPNASLALKNDNVLTLCSLVNSGLRFEIASFGYFSTEAKIIIAVRFEEVFHVLTCSLWKRLYQTGMRTDV
ncbi:26S proteasome non-ATPase regulatory subunit 1 [Dirofilaria immitis]|nr:26S proteasome non-ATPase regulatory subunit 1 [Dirofilaria immitis]